jgi:hypothetical protein
LNGNIDHFSFWFADETPCTYKMLVGHEYKAWDFLFGIDSISDSTSEDVIGIQKKDPRIRVSFR